MGNGSFSATTNGLTGTSQNGIDYTGGGGGAGHKMWKASFANNPSGNGGCGVIIIKQGTVPPVPSAALPNATHGWGLQLWLDGSDPLNGAQPSNDATVATWVDKSGYGRNAVAYVSGSNAKFRQGQNEGLPSTCGALYFANTPYEVPMTFSPATYTIISVFRADGPVNNSTYDDANDLSVLTGPSDYQLWFGVEGGTFTARAGNGSNAWGTGISNPMQAYRQWAIMTMQYTDSTRTIDVWVNGVSFSTVTNAAGQNGGSSWTNLYIGQNATNTSGAYKLKGCIAEILIYNTVLSSTHRSSVEAWLSQKYSVGVSV